MLLATDLDGTFLAGESSKRRQLYQLVTTHSDFKLVFVTGRGLESVMPLLVDPTIPRPDYIICDVGATIVDGETLRPVQPIQTEIERHWPGERTIETAMAEYTECVRQDVPQERRCSYFCAPEAFGDHLKEIAESLGCELLYSAQWYLDFLPKGVNKGTTLRALVEHLGIDHDDVLVSGDTMNDLSMFEAGFRSVCVGKSEKGLLSATEGMDHVYHAKASGCGGILEAISHYELATPAALSARRVHEITPGESELVIVYHRLPFEEYLDKGELSRRAHRSPNGILPTLLSFFGDGKRGSWIAWSTYDQETPGFERRTTVDTSLYPNLVAARVPVSQDDVEIFYKKFSKEAFWPTLHTFWEQASFREDHWQVFVKVNRIFAEEAAKEAAEGAVVWIHDYNLWMVPAYLREMRPDVTIAFFHHTYFPSADVFNVIPWRRDIIGSLLQCDLVGFHIPRQSENFVDVALGVTPLEVKETSTCAPRFLTYGCAVGLDEMTTRIGVQGREIHLAALPVGLDLARIDRALADERVHAKARELQDSLRGNQVIFAVERLDYTKGIVSKLEAFELLLARHPELIGKVTLVNICVPAAKEMTIYRDLQTQIEQTVGRINGRFARVGWTPLQFFFRRFSFEDLVAYYSVADVMWVTPLRDGLNLVAKEYVGTQGRTGGRGVLVLSEFAGVAAELRGALLTNPHDSLDMVSTCHQALRMDEMEATARMREAYDVVLHNDIRAWGDEFLDAIEAARRRPDTDTSVKRKAPPAAE